MPKRPSNPRVARCSCEESLRLRRALREVRLYLIEMGAGGYTIGSMNGDDGAAGLLRKITEAMR